MPSYKNPYRCPECNGSGGWRRGVGFEHQKICMSKNHKKSVIWDPYDIEKENKRLELSLKNQFGDGI